MPNYDLLCDNGHEFERFLRFSDLEDDQICECGRPATRLIRAPILFVRQDVCYDSPIDGRAITNKQARIEDLKRSGCIEYDPGMKQDADRRVRDNEARLDKHVDATVDAAIEHMPSRKRELLQAELSSGVTAEPVRQTRSA